MRKGTGTEMLHADDEINVHARAVFELQGLTEQLACDVDLICMRHLCPTTWLSCGIAQPSEAYED